MTRATTGLPSPLAAERLETRALLAVTATLSGGDLIISLNAAGDVLAEIASSGTNYTVSGTGLPATSFAVTDVTGRIRVVDPGGIDGQTFRVASGSPLANALEVNNSIETTELVVGIEATVPGDVYIGSASVRLGSGSSTAQVVIDTSVTNGRVDLPGTVTLLADTTFRSGSGSIATGAVTDGAAAFTLSLGSLAQTGEITFGGNVTLDDLATSAGAFGVRLNGLANDITQQVTFTNTFFVSIGTDTSAVSRFSNGLTASSQTAANLLIGTVRTAGAPIEIGGSSLTGLTTLDTSDDGAVTTGAAIKLLRGLRLEDHVLTTIGGVGAVSSPTYLLGTSDVDGGALGIGSLVVATGSLFIGGASSPTLAAALTVTRDLQIRVASDELYVSGDATIDAPGASLTLLADRVTIASAAGSIDGGRIGFAPVTAGRGIFLGNATGPGMVLDESELRAIGSGTIMIGGAGYTGHVTIGTLALAGTALEIITDGTGGGVTLAGPFTSTGTSATGVGLQITGSGAKTLLNANITSTGDVIIDDAVELAATTVTIATSGESDVLITGGTGGIWSSEGEANDLVVSAVSGRVSLATRSGFGDQDGQADPVRNVTMTGGSALLGNNNLIAGALAIGAPQVTLAAVVRAAGAIGIDDGTGGAAAVVVAGNTDLDATQDGKIPTGNPVTVRGTVTASDANSYLFRIKAGTASDVLVTGRIGIVDSGPALGTVIIAGNDVTVASIDGLSQGLFLEAADAPGGVDPGSVTLTGTTYRSTTSAGIAVGSRDSTNALGSAENRITLAGGVAGATTSFVTRGFDVEFSGHVDLAGRNLAIDTTGGGVAPAGSFIYLNDSINGAGTLTLDGGTAGDLSVNHLTGSTGGTTPLAGITIANGRGVSFSGMLRAGTVRVVDATDAVTFGGVLDVTGGFVAEAQPYAIRLLGGNAGSSRIAGLTTFSNTGAVELGDEGPLDVITFAGGLVATAPSAVRLMATILADEGSIVLGDADTRVTVAAAAIGGTATAITLADVDLLTNAGLVLGTGRATTVRVGSVTGTIDGFADALTIDTTGSASFTGSVGSGVDRVTVTKSGGTTFEAAVAAGIVTLTDTVGTIAFQGDLTTSELNTAPRDYSVAFRGAVTSVAGTTSFLNKGTVAFGDQAGDRSTFIEGLVTTAGPSTASIAGALVSNGTILLGAVTLAAETTLTATGDVTIEGPLGGPHALSVASPGVTTLRRSVGSVGGLLGSLTTDAAGSTILGGGEAGAFVRTTGAQTYNDGVTLAANTTFQGALIRFGGTLVGGRFGLEISAPASQQGGDAVFDGTVSVGYLSVSGATTVAGPSITTIGDQTYTGTVTITAPAVVLRGAGATSGRIATGPDCGLELDFTEVVSLPLTTTPLSEIGALTVSDGILVGSAVVGSLLLAPAATFEVAVPPGSGYGQITVASSSTATVDLGSAGLTLTGSSPLPVGSILTIVNNGGTAPVTGTFANLPEGSLIDSPVGVCCISYVGGDGNDVTLEVVNRDNVVSIEDDLLFVRLAGGGTTVRNLSTQYVPASRRLVLTVASAPRLSGGGTGLTVNQRARTVTVNLAQVPGFRGVVVLGTGATDRITLGPRGVNLAALTAGATSQVFAIDARGGEDVVTVRNPVRTKGAEGGCVIQAARVNLGASINTQLGTQRYRGRTQLVGATRLTGGEIAFDSTLDGAHHLTIDATGNVEFVDAVGGESSLRGITIQRAASVRSSSGMQLDGRGLGPAANGLVIGHGVASVSLDSEDPSTRPVVISRFGGSGILFEGGSQNSSIANATLTGNGQGITFAPGDYSGTSVLANAILQSRRAGITLDGARNVTLGGTGGGEGNLIEGGAAPRPSGKGIIASGLLTGTRVVGNTIDRSNGGIVMRDARGLSVGGAGVSNTVTRSIAWGLVATGNCEASVLDASGISGNTPGNVNVRRARGLVIVQPA